MAQLLLRAWAHMYIILECFVYLRTTVCIYSVNKLWITIYILLIMPYHYITI